MSHQVYRPYGAGDEDDGDEDERQAAPVTRHDAVYRPDPAGYSGQGPGYTEYEPPDRFLADVELDALEAAEPEFARAHYSDGSAQDDGTPSLPVILVSAACGLGGGVIGLYLTYAVFAWPLPWVAAATTLALLSSLGISGAIMSVATGTRAAPANILFSCGLLLTASLFLGLCSVVGALVATLIFRI